MVLAAHATQIEVAVVVEVVHLLDVMVHQAAAHDMTAQPITVVD